jgi:aryl-alcohol dehydrogenase-like predicted oxidoreductase
MEIPQSVKDSIAATKVDYVQLGKSGLRVSVPILGAMSFGDPAWAPWVIDEEKVGLYPYIKSRYTYYTHLTYIP